MQLSTRFPAARWEYWRIVLALAAKDIVDALRNKTTLTMLLGLGMMILTVQALPLLLKLDDRPRVAIYDADRSGLADDLRRDRVLQVSEMRSAEDTQNLAPEASGPLLALVLPTGWQDQSGAVEATGYLAHWVAPDTARQLASEAERTLTRVSGRQVIIRPQTVYPTLESGGHNVMVASGLVLATVLVTAILVPYLILEEKTNHTLELLRVAPVSVNQILLGKGIAGLAYGVLAAGMLLAFNLAMVNQWSLMLPALLAIVLFGVGIGLLVGTLVQNEGAVQMWVGLLAVLLLLPIFLSFVDSSRIPAWLQQLLGWLPTTAAFDLFRLSFGNTAPPAHVWPNLLALLVAVLLVFGATSWRLRTWEA